MGRIADTGFRAIALRSLVQIVRRPLLWVCMLGLPLFLMLFITTMFCDGLPTQVTASIVDLDGTAMSRQLTQTLAGMQMVDDSRQALSFTEARHAMQEGEIYGFFIIPENFEADLLAGRGPALTFYTNMSYFVPGSMLYKTFMSGAVYTKAGTVLALADAVGVGGDAVSPLLQPVQVAVRPIGNPTLNYGIYLGNSFIPAVLQLMIILVTVFTLGQEVKHHTSPQLLRMAGGSIGKAVAAKLFPQTVIWCVLALFMLSWLYRFNHYPMHGSWFWMGLSELLFVLASQAFGLFLIGLIPNMRFALSVGALLGILAFSLAGFSFPVERMYPAMGIFGWIYPVRYNFLIYADQALAGRHIYWSRVWYLAYLGFIVLPLTVLPRLKKSWSFPVYTP